MSNSNPTQEQVGYLALAVAQLCIVLIELGPLAGTPAPGELLQASMAVRSYGQRLIRS